MKKAELLELLRRNYKALEAVTELYGCDLLVAILLTQTENVLREAAERKAVKFNQVSHRVH